MWDVYAGQLSPWPQYPPPLLPLFFVKGFWSLSLGETVTMAEGFLELEYMLKNQLKNEYRHIWFFLLHFLLTSRVYYQMTKIKLNGCLLVIWSQRENLLCYKWLLILFLTVTTPCHLVIINTHTGHILKGRPMDPGELIFFFKLVFKRFPSGTNIVDLWLSQNWYPWFQHYVGEAGAPEPL